MLNNWPDFIKKLKDAKKLSKTKGISVPCITNLLFAGAFDEIIGTEVTKSNNKTAVYNRLFNEVRDALKSKASLPTKKKGEVIGLSSVDGDLQLALWRQQINPLSSFDLIGAYMEQLKIRGYEKDPNPGATSYRKKNPDGTVNFLLPEWGHIFKYRGTPHWEAVAGKNPGGFIVYLGIVTEVSSLKWANGTKDMIKFRLYMGKEVTDEIVCWPERDTNQIREYTKSAIKPGTMALFRVKPSFYLGRRGASLIDFDVIGGRTSV